MVAGVTILTVLYSPNDVFRVDSVHIEHFDENKSESTWKTKNKSETGHFLSRIEAPWKIGVENAIVNASSIGYLSLWFVTLSSALLNRNQKCWWRSGITSDPTY